jgi:hypothetical protein
MNVPLILHLRVSPYASENFQSIHPVLDSLYNPLESGIKFLMSKKSDINLSPTASFLGVKSINPMGEL